MTDRFVKICSLQQALFWGLGLLMCVLAVGFVFFSFYFSYDYEVKEMPIWRLVAGLVGIGLVFVCLRGMVGKMARPTFGRPIAFTAGLFAIGLVLRLIMMASEPVLEDDYQRYLWDGALIVNGLNPYQFSPSEVLTGQATPQHEDLREKAGFLVERINHPQLRTIYPVGAEAMFSLAHKFAPFSLTAWRLIILLSELITFGLLLLMVRHVGRDEIWLVLYWWNPLVIKELINSAHMEAVLLPFLLAGVFAGMKGRFFLASGALSLAASIKIWPALLLPLIWRRLISCNFRQVSWLVGSVVFALLVGAFIVWAFFTSGLNDSSGLVVYAQKWKTNSAFFPAFEAGVAWLAALLKLDNGIVPYLARGAIGIGILMCLLRLLMLPVGSSHQLLSHLFIMSLLIFLFSPAQFPWYLLWVAPFLVFYPLWGLVLLVPLMAVYYGGFALFVAGVHSIYQPWLVLLIWLPVWMALLMEARAVWRSADAK